MGNENRRRMPLLSRGDVRFRARRRAGNGTKAEAKRKPRLVALACVLGVAVCVAVPAPPVAEYGQPEKIATLKNSLDIDAELRLFTGDINSDGFCDVGVLWTTAFVENAFAVEILLNDQKGGLVPGTREVLGDETVQTMFIAYPDTMVVVKDLNADGKNDLFIAMA